MSIEAIGLKIIESIDVGQGADSPALSLRRLAPGGLSGGLPGGLSGVGPEAGGMDAGFSKLLEGLSGLAKVSPLGAAGLEGLTSGNTGHAGLPGVGDPMKLAQRLAGDLASQIMTAMDGPTGEGGADGGQFPDTSLELAPLLGELELKAAQCRTLAGVESDGPGPRALAQAVRGYGSLEGLGPDPDRQDRAAQAVKTLLGVG